MGKNATEKIITKYSNEKNVEANTPPTFLVHATDDGSVPVENSINYYLALKNNNVLVEMHLFQKGGHGFGLGKTDSSKNWTYCLENWLKFVN